MFTLTWMSGLRHSSVRLRYSERKNTLTDWWLERNRANRPIIQPTPSSPASSTPVIILGCNLGLDSQAASFPKALGPVCISIFCYACHMTRPNHRSQFGVRIMKLLTAHFFLSVTPIPLADLQLLSSAPCSWKPSSLNLKKIPRRRFKLSAQQNSY